METAASSSRTPELAFLKTEDDVASAFNNILSEILTMVSIVDIVVCRCPLCLYCLHCFQYTTLFLNPLDPIEDCMVVLKFCGKFKNSTIVIWKKTNYYYWFCRVLFFSCPLDLSEDRRRVASRCISLITIMPI